MGFRSGQLERDLLRRVYGCFPGVFGLILNLGASEEDGVVV